ncbi:MAG: hypothetical protein ACK4OJ_00260 [Brevundimonas sp.]
MSAITSLFGEPMSYPCALTTGVQDEIIVPYFEAVCRDAGAKSVRHSDVTDEGDDIYDIDGQQYLLNVRYFRDDVETHLHDAEEVRVNLQPYPWF